ncbi:Myb-like_DNA-binding domain-containing protein [Hexamita inflata]|uniref:Myb-like DNA-binding domain-containing protein n=1 Tax=Hexamita inflata TaxID=28002 RepID=A0AA86PJY2_9EUKA|nr:Myb-like DNA-binding domain-containing protein [Hexamita inflata]
MPQYKWTEDDIQQLINAVQQSKNDKRINWSKVAEFLPGRTPVQCKSQYTARINYKPTEKVNMVWNYDACVLLSAYVHIYNSNWQFISEIGFKNQIKPDALKKQYTLVSQVIQKNMAKHAEHVLEAKNLHLDRKTFYLYALIQGLNFRLLENDAKILAKVSEQPPPKVLLAPIYEHIPILSAEIYAETAEQTMYMPFYRKLEKEFRLQEVIEIVDKLIAKTDPKLIAKMGHEYDQNRANIHKMFLQ